MVAGDCKKRGRREGGGSCFFTEIAKVCDISIKRARHDYLEIISCNLFSNDVSVSSKYQSINCNCMRSVIAIGHWRQFYTNSK